MMETTTSTEECTSKLRSSLGEVKQKGKAFAESNWQALDALFNEAEALEQSDNTGEIYGAKWELQDALEECGITMDPRRFQDFKVELVKGAYSGKPKIQDDIGKTKAKAVAARGAEQLEGKLSWVSGDSHENEFRKWVTGAIPSLNESSKMNCWEAILYAAFTKGIISKQKIVGLYQGMLGGSGTSSLESAFGEQESLYSLTKRGKTLKRGDVLIFTEIAGHVALSLGGGAAMSLWSKPNGLTTFQQTTIEQLIGREEEWLDIMVVKKSPLFG